ncbi:hypothetical protein ACSAZL_07580 [Methanosarcina sp. T3]
MQGTFKGAKYSFSYFSSLGMLFIIRSGGDHAAGKRTLSFIYDL